MNKIVSAISILGVGFLSVMGNAQAQTFAPEKQTWSFEQQQDKFTDKKHFIASTPDLKIGAREKLKSRSSAGTNRISYLRSVRITTLPTKKSCSSCGTAWMQKNQRKSKCERSPMPARAE